jgi:16S rRNA (guanine527-N7)-methyltransferase
VKHEAWGPWSDRLDLEITHEQAASLEVFERLLAERALPLGMVASGDGEHLRERHLVDSVRAAALLGSRNEEVADLGSGAGLPGIPLAIVRPHLSFRLIDVRQRRVAFMEFVVDALALTNVVVVRGSIEGAAAPVDVCLARALANPIRTWRLAEPLLSPTGRLLYWGGRRFDASSGTPEGARISVSTSPALADAGPLVIMTRQ